MAGPSPSKGIAKPGALRFFPNGALRLHAAHVANVANVHETVCDWRAFLRGHRPITAGTSNDGKLVHLPLHALPGWLK